ncbi:aldehyde dehydrogenase (NADP(+)) [Nocardioides sp.]|uniref:aldehyde dehydrogenase (NADP(+)) n=1 Tax=Nocardioides sp. TaxID=35761 RepID=UPI0031FEC813|nr:Aldehyde Dehydrogenase [Nocardioides sp.]
MPDVESVDPRTGEVRLVVGPETTAHEVHEICVRARAAHRTIRTLGRAWRAGLLRAMADVLESGRELVVTTADAETALGTDRLNGELTRTCFQLRMFADVVDDGGFLEVVIDHAGPTDMGPRPDLRRMLVPVGPTAVFGASNFPLAFSVPGGDTASALAAGNPVIVKAHESHPATALLCAALMTEAATAVGAPEGTIGIVFGRAAGAQLVQHPEISAVGFTGSPSGGRALMRLAEARPAPIPFYGELGSLNPVVVTAAAAAERAEEVGQGLAASFTLGVGQFCTKPGLAFVPSGPDGDVLVASAAAVIEAGQSRVMLNAQIGEAFQRQLASLKSCLGVREVAATPQRDADGRSARAHLLEVSSQDLIDSMFEECFGPVSMVVRYDDVADLLPVLARVPPSLTATLHTGSDEGAVDGALREVLEEAAGRIVYNGFPTGVAVSWAQHHGGAWPASNSLHTSVGATAVRRFLRPRAWQDAPTALLPVELRDEPCGIPRRVDGVVVPTPA